MGYDEGASNANKSARVGNLNALHGNPVDLFDGFNGPVFGAVGIDREVEEALRGVGYEIARDGEHHWHDLGLRTNLKRAGVLIDKHVPQA